MRLRASLLFVEDDNRRGGQLHRGNDPLAKVITPSKKEMTVVESQR